MGSEVVREKDQDTKGLGSRSRLDPTLLFSFYFIETLSITGQKCPENDSDSLRKRRLRRELVRVVLPLRITNQTFSKRNSVRYFRSNPCKTQS